ncbi:N-acetylglucosaminyl-phosphatidylinositol de-N-acetylase [Ceratocystis pirilliformis]|uniref:N-acetylglucosaminylphosphatidylinositol deacetylase n=1 Tax=Ceratocystis pirilliformis TaxID=259994 RepID=A0ABR3YPJ0_9PEZI
MKMVSAGLRLHDPAMASLLAVGAALVALPALYASLASAVQPRLPILHNKRVCLLIAHPDDEAMFFAPTVLALTRPETGNHVKILCLSSGDADGLGETRKKELQKSAVLLGLRTENDVFVVESPDFPDSMTARWDEGKISNFLARLFTTIHSATQTPISNIDVIVTFDQHGISSHPNHISLFHGARTFISKLARIANDGGRSPVDLYTLTTVGMLRKYVGFHDALVSLLVWLGSGTGFVSPPATEITADDNTGEEDDSARESPKSLIFFSSFRGSSRDIPSVTRARAAMTQAHVSQMRWFRWGWITFSRYMYLNDLRLISPVALDLTPSDNVSEDAPDDAEESAEAASDVDVSNAAAPVPAAPTPVIDSEPKSHEAKREKEKHMRERDPEKDRSKQRQRSEKAPSVEAEAEASEIHKSERKHKKHGSRKSKK